MMFMSDAVKATIDLMEAPEENLSVHSSYNVGGISFTPEQLFTEIRKHMPELITSYKPDFRQAIAESWPASINDQIAQNDWGLTMEHDLGSMTKLMLDRVKKKFK